jgi:hypothetical protein
MLVNQVSLLKAWLWMYIKTLNVEKILLVSQPAKWEKNALSK